MIERHKTTAKTPSGTVVTELVNLKGSKYPATIRVSTFAMTDAAAKEQGLAQPIRDIRVELFDQTEHSWVTIIGPMDISRDEIEEWIAKDETWERTREFLNRYFGFELTKE